MTDTRTTEPQLLRTDIDLEFADGVYLFALPMPQMFELEQKTGLGIGALFARCIKGASVAKGNVLLAPADAEFSAIQIVEVVRQALIGGAKGTVDGVEYKVTPPIANRMISSYLVGRPLSEAWEMAVAILAAVVVGHDPGRQSAPVPA